MHFTVESDVAVVLLHGESVIGDFHNFLFGHAGELFLELCEGLLLNLLEVDAGSVGELLEGVGESHGAIVVVD